MASERARLSEEARRVREEISLEADHVANVSELGIFHVMKPYRRLMTLDILQSSSTAFPGAYPGIDDSWSLERFKKGLKIEIISMSDMEMEFDLIGVDAAYANTLRRILIAEVHGAVRWVWWVTGSLTAVS